MDTQYKYLQLVKYSSLLLWDIKRYFTTQVLSSFPVVRLGDYINEESTKYSISDPNKRYGILGVNNKDGIFDAYEESGSKIKQKYKKMQVGWIAYNPYRVNVGSIGIRTNEHNYDYISPAYVVFSCKSGLLPGFLFLLLKTDLFNKIIRENTTGSVRQNLNFSILSNLQIPLPTMNEQKEIVAAYRKSILMADQYEQKVEEKEEDIEKFILSRLEIRPQETFKTKSQYLTFVRSKDIKEWGYDKITGSNKNVLLSNMFENKSLIDLVVINPQTRTPALPKDASISFIPMECISDIDGEWIERRTCPIQNSNGYTKFIDGDLLWAKITPCMQNGKSAIVRGLENGFGCGSTEFHVLREHDKNLKIEYLYILLRLSIVLQDAKKSFVGSAGQQRVPKSYLENLSIPVPPIEVQNEIVAHVFELKEQIKSLRALAANTRTAAIQQFEQTIFE